MLYKGKNILLPEHLIYITILFSIFILTFYIYIKRHVPFVPYIKDLLLLFILPLTTLNLIISSWKIKKLNYIDKAIAVLFVYLLFQFLRTGIELSFSASYSGFRLTYMYILLYFIYTSIKYKHLLVRIDKIIFMMLIVGLLITLLEAFFIKSGFVSIESLSKIMVVNRYDNQAYFRVYGITGSVHLTGLYNTVFFAILLFGCNIKKNQIYLNGFIFLKHIKLLKSKALLLITFFAVLVSLSQTAWTAMGLILIVYIFSSYKFNAARLLNVLIVLLIGVIFTILYFGDHVYQTYISFATIYFDWFIRDVTPLLDDFWFGSGYHVSQSAVGVDYAALTRNNTINTDMFFLDIISNLGFIGLVLYGMLFGLIPLYIIFCKKYNYILKLIAAPIVVIGIGFAHYCPLQNPAINIIIWYLFAQLSRMLDYRSRSLLL